MRRESGFCEGRRQKHLNHAVRIDVRATEFAGTDTHVIRDELGNRESGDAGSQGGPRGDRERYAHADADEPRPGNQILQSIAGAWRTGGPAFRGFSVPSPYRAMPYPLRRRALLFLRFGVKGGIRITVHAERFAPISRFR